jgi:superfamily I DNA/RNA helicase
LNITEGWQGTIDFDDQVYLSVIYRCSFPKADLFIGDEVQDWNPIQRTMASLMLKPTGRLIAFGDKHQAIYGFRGADRDSMENLITEFSCFTLPLSISFRCPKNVVIHAQHYIPGIEPYEQQLDGKVCDDKNPTVDKLHSMHVNRGKVSVLCRNNAPLVKLCLMFYKQSLPCTILGRDIAKGLQTLVTKQKCSSLSELNSKLWNYIGTQQEFLRTRNKTSQANLLEDQGECIEALLAHELPNGTIESLKERIQSLFSDKETGSVTLSTIHKAKGKEWPNVFILDPELMPSKFAKTDKEIEQETNLHYVAITRAQQTLTYIQTKDL